MIGVLHDPRAMTLYQVRALTNYRWPQVLADSSVVEVVMRVRSATKEGQGFALFIQNS